MRKRKNHLGLDKNKILAMDLGINNFATCVSTEVTPFMIDGADLKNILYFKNKKIAHYQSKANKQGLKTTKRIQKINNKTRNKTDNFLNHTVKYIIETCKTQDIGTIIIGYNPNFQYKPTMGHKNNQIFTEIAYKKFIQKIETKCKIHGIQLILQEESYTSQASFLDNDEIPIYNPNKKEKHEFSGKRIKRGLYKSKDGTLINADVNAACNILKKSTHEFNYEQLVKRLKYSPQRIKIKI